MGIFFNPTNEGFKEVANSNMYVDKTGLLAYTNSVLETLQKYICVSRPRRFGKTITARMLAGYYVRTANSLPLFENFEIAQHEDFYKHIKNDKEYAVDTGFEGAVKFATITGCYAGKGYGLCRTA